MEIIIIIALVLLNGVFAMSELSLVSSSPQHFKMFRKGMTVVPTSF